MERIEPRQEGRIEPGRRGVVVREDVDPLDAVDRIVVQLGTSVLVVAGQVLPDNHAQVDAVVPAQRIGDVLDVVDREVVVAPLLEVGRDPLTLGIEHRDVEDIARPHEPVNRIGKHQLLEELVAELVGDRVDAEGYALPRAEGDLRPPAPRRGVDLEAGTRGEKALRVHVDLQVLRAFEREVHVEQHGLLPDAPLPVVPAVLLVGIGLLVEPDVEVRAEEPLVRGLPHVLLQLGGRDAFVARCGAVGFDLHPLQQVLPLGDMPRDAACRPDEEQHHGDEYAAHPPHGVTPG